MLPKLDLKWALGELDVHEPMAIHLFALSTLYYYLCVEFTIRFKESLKFTKATGNPGVVVLGLLSQNKFYYTFG